MNSEISSEIIHDAINWMVEVQSGEMTELQYQKFLQWRASNALHDKACLTVERMLQGVSSANELIEVDQVLHSRGSRRQFMRSALSLASVSLFAGLLINRNTPVAGLLADVHTRTAERKIKTLEDGTHLILNARTSANIDIDTSQRKITLLQGKVYIDAKKLNTPLQVASNLAKIEIPTGGRFVIAAHGTRLHIASLTQPALIHSATHSKQLAAGQGVLVTETMIADLAVNPNEETSWTQGYLELRNRPLGILIDALQDYRSGFLRISEEAAQLNVSGLFSLDDSNTTLDMVARTLPVTINRSTEFFVTLSKST